MNYNFHTHTYRCGHATGTPREYIDRAVSCGIRFFGFSEHLPQRFPDGYESFYRLPVDQAGDYVAELSALRKEYQDRIQLFIGFEMEYYPLYFSQMLQNAIDFGAEYLILGQHYLRNEHPDSIYSGSPTDDIALLQEYVDTVIDAIKTGVFTYVAHPDLFHFTGNETDYLTEMDRLITASKTYNTPLEINLLGLREHRHYPNPIFWKRVGELGAPVTFGFDAHDALSAYDADSLKVAENWVLKYHLNDIGKPTLKPLH